MCFWRIQPRNVVVERCGSYTANSQNGSIKMKRFTEDEGVEFEHIMRELLHCSITKGPKKLLGEDDIKFLQVFFVSRDEAKMEWE